MKASVLNVEGIQCFKYFHALLSSKYVPRADHFIACQEKGKLCNPYRKTQCEGKLECNTFKSYIIYYSVSTIDALKFMNQ